MILFRAKASSYSNIHFATAKLRGLCHAAFLGKSNRFFVTTSYTMARKLAFNFVLFQTSPVQTHSTPIYIQLKQKIK